MATRPERERSRTPGRTTSYADSAQYLLLAILAIAFLTRLVIALRTGVQIDESRFVFAVDTVARTGVPVLGSDVLYLVGTPASYLFAPLAWVFDGTDLLYAIRIGNALLSTVAVFVIWRLVWELTGSLAVTVGVAFCAALDPMGLYWGTIAAMNASLALIATLVVYSAFRVLAEPDERVLRRLDASNPLVWLVFWLLLGSFTYYAIWLFVPAIIVASIVRWKRALLQPRHPVWIALEVAIIFPILVWLFGDWAGPGAGTSFNPGPPGFNQIWNNWERLRDVSFNLDVWRALYYGSRYSQAVALLIVLATGVIAGWLFLRHRIADRERGAGRIPVALLVLMVMSYWLPILIVADGSSSTIVSGVIPFGYFVIAYAIWLVVPDWSFEVSRRRIRMGAPVVLAVVLMLPVLVYALQGVRWQIGYETPDADYFAASEFAESVKQPGQQILTPFPAAAWLVMDPSNRMDIIPLAGPEGGQRIGSETRNLGSRDGQTFYVDYWTGKQAIGNQSLLCQYLLYSSPMPLIIIDTSRLGASWAFDGKFGTAISSGTQVVSEGDNGIQVRTPLPLEQWPADAQDACGIKPATEG